MLLIPEFVLDLQSSLIRVQNVPDKLDWTPDILIPAATSNETVLENAWACSVIEVIQSNLYKKSSLC